jgi:hypothetical protein
MIKMKNIKIYLLTLLTIVSFGSCADNDNDELTGDAITGGLLTVNTRSIGYVVGDGGTYIASGSVFQGNDQTTSIGIYISFTDSQTGETSNEKLYETIQLADTSIGSNVDFSSSFSYENLSSDLSLSDGPVSSDDTQLNIGDFFNVRYESTLKTGSVITNSVSTKVSVGTRFAGTYAPLAGAYYRIGVLTYETADWLLYCPETLIESVDATTYRVIEYFGVFGGNEWYFQIDSNDRISYPDNTPSGDAQTGNGAPFITCAANSADLTNIPCGLETNKVIRSDDGKDILVMSFGYYTAGSGSREFYQELEKIVE